MLIVLTVRSDDDGESKSSDDRWLAMIINLKRLRPCVGSEPICAPPLTL